MATWGSGHIKTWGLWTHGNLGALDTWKLGGPGHMATWGLWTQKLGGPGHIETWGPIPLSSSYVLYQKNIAFGAARILQK